MVSCIATTAIVVLIAVVVGWIDAMTFWEAAGFGCMVAVATMFLQYLLTRH